MKAPINWYYFRAWDTNFSVARLADILLRQGHAAEALAPVLWCLNLQKLWPIRGAELSMLSMFTVYVCPCYVVHHLVTHHGNSLRQSPCCAMCSQVAKSNLGKSIPGARQVLIDSLILPTEKTHVCSLLEIPPEKPTYLMSPWSHVCIIQQLLRLWGVSMPCTYWPRQSWRHQPPRQRSCKAILRNTEIRLIFISITFNQNQNVSKSLSILESWCVYVPLVFFRFAESCFFCLIELYRPRRSSVKELAMHGSWVWPNKHLPLCKI